MGNYRVGELVVNFMLFRGVGIGFSLGVVGCFMGILVVGIVIKILGFR